MVHFCGIHQRSSDHHRTYWYNTYNMNKAASRNWFGPGAAFHHAGIAVASVEDLKRDVSEVFEDLTQNVAVAFLDCSGCCIELIAPLGLTSPVSLALKKGQKLLHLCFEVDILEDALSTAVSHGFRSVAKPVPALAFGGRRIAWVYSLRYGLFELLEKRN